MTPSNLDNIKAMILGLATGDALGVPYEFLSRSTLESNLPTGMKGYGTYMLPAGTWSDDTTMTLCLMKSLCSGLNYEDLAAKFKAWILHGYMTPYGTPFDIGNTTLQSIHRYNKGAAACEAGGLEETDNGNGSLMRVSPLVFFLSHHTPEERRQIVFNVSSVTHGHVRSQIACWFYVEMMIQVLEGKSKQEAIDHASSVIQAWTSLNAPEETIHFSRCTSNIEQLDKSDIKSYGYVIDTLEAVLWSFLTTDSYSAAVLQAVSLGEDTDTIGAITGSVAGLFYGLDSIPPEWIKTVHKHEAMETLCYEFHEVLSTGKYHD